MLRILLVQPGSTELDDQGRIKGCLDIPLSATGTCQVERTVVEVADLPIDYIYSSPCQSAQQTAGALARERRVRLKPLPQLSNLDHGLWHGKLIEEVRQNQPKVYRQWQDNPEQVWPPGGETLAAARLRVRRVLEKLLRKHKSGLVAIVIPEPLASVARSLLVRRGLGDLWKSECDHGGWELIDIEPEQVALS